MNDLTEKERIALAARKVLATIEGDCPAEVKLWSSVLSLAIKDLGHNNYKHSAMAYLSNRQIPAAELIGIDSDYVRLILRKLGINIREQYAKHH